MTAISRRVVLVAAGATEPSGPDLSDLRSLVNRGWDARLITPATDARSLSPELRGHVISGWRRAPRVGAALALARAGSADPAATWRCLRARDGVSRTWPGRQLAGRLLALRPRLVIFDSARSAGRWRAATEALGCANVVNLTADDLYGAGDRPFAGCEAVWTRASALLFADSALERRALARGCPPDRPRAVIPAAVDTALFAPEAEGRRAPGPLRIVSAAALDWMQGLEHAIHAVRLLRDAGVESTYTIIGEGNYLPALTFARHQLGVAEEVRFLGRVSHGELCRQLRCADVFLSASVVDGLPRTVLEALASGTPAVMSEPGDLGDAAVPSSAAVTVPRRQPAALAAALGTLATSEPRRREMGQAARQWALAHVAPAHRLAGLDGLLRRTLAEAGSTQ